LAEIETAAPVLLAPFALAVLLVLLEAALEGLEDALLGAAELEAGGEGVGIGAEEAPLISCWIVELKVPVIPDKVNFAEKASSKAPAALGSWND